MAANIAAKIAQIKKLDIFENQQKSTPSRISFTNARRNFLRYEEMSPSRIKSSVSGIRRLVCLR